MSPSLQVSMRHCSAVERGKQRQSSKQNESENILKRQATDQKSVAFAFDSTKRTEMENHNIQYDFGDRNWLRFSILFV